MLKLSILKILKWREIEKRRSRSWVRFAWNFRRQRSCRKIIASKSIGTSLSKTKKKSYSSRGKRYWIGLVGRTKSFLFVLIVYQTSSSLIFSKAIVISGIYLMRVVITLGLEGKRIKLLRGVMQP